MKLSKPVKIDSRICFSISYFESEKEADIYADYVVKQGFTYNGGFYHGMPCGRDKSCDYEDENGKKLYAVTEQGVWYGNNQHGAL